MADPKDTRDGEKKEEGVVPVKKKPFDIFVIYFEIALVLFLVIGFTLWEIWDYARIFFR